MFWRRKKTADPLDDPRFAPAGAATPVSSPVTPPSLAGGGSRLLVEDVFTITGRGTVATGAVEAGTLQVGRQVAVYREGQAIAVAVIQAIETFGKTQDAAHAGDHVGLMLAGLSRDLLRRGDQIVAGG